MNPTQTQPQNPALAIAVTKALGYTENGGQPNIKNPSAGKSGEMKSIFQYTPATWKAVAGKYLGNPNAPLTPDDETVATTARVSDWLDKGYTPEQIFSMHNAGVGEPDAYTGKFSDGSSSSGTNKYGVKYNVSDYVKKGMKYLSEFDPDIKSKVSSVQGAPDTPPQEQGASDHASALLALLKGATQSASRKSSSSGNEGMLATAPQQNKGPQVAGLLAKPKQV